MRKLKTDRGFTFIEIILYVSIVSIILVALVPFAWNVIGGSVKSSAEQEVNSQARFISERIKYEVRNADGINSVAAASISLDPPGTSNDPTIIDLSGGRIRIKLGAAADVDLNSTDTNITSLIFTNYTSGDNKTKHIQFVFVIDDNFGSGRTEYDVPAQTIEGSAEVRSN
ncbi:hypothetical protein A3F00_05420 [Candidatus Daviesbacteria bacterium RIFCSPHIGHO2_12_FULL_37_11]|uniref:General secretion pathway GspH domain-containing protein n=1 Tax=Candidatus Daviesbacteria bacterium RIFCSPHIGHO2_12_FULL_37_11 TaxID=1797777 RepID=A0A1F5KC92_9BACT|nr:MAG: hypothetical protein A2769_00625 [Candidatus Daviesbacteria bacterium RIFCSPHIGHO2_01_FULL_37_27]OGE38489.1 MAG: hypothetical protein A3F00_05420 [Candidatus Daviesbacteria bacterium RIFCSPHIGHO2_12_FULL_37_11]OGE45704.1 MAG: hypothetical protein A3B39_05285 [Candidatus Daviesbacteria bacterium RIFCSPLOWO2_01_FULL_37_10]